jgi:uncharacterized membrane protein
MLDPVLDHKPRGFSGRPVIALALAITMGLLASYVSSRLGLREPIVLIVFCGVYTLVAYIWYRAEKPA